MPPTPSSSPPAAFVPRREFIRAAQKPVPNTFSLLTFSSSNCIRLYSFPVAVVSSIRLFLEQSHTLVGCREDVGHNFCEFALDGKPWANPKSVASECLIVDILAIVFQHGYSVLTTIDYGREHDDRLALALAKPVMLPPSRSDSPLHLLPEAAGSVLSDRLLLKRSPFGLSFPSAKLLRVVSPPLHSTPAILQAVRGAWPRGVLSERKIGVNSYEFKLKGYSWFQADTFATDSLKHILTVLASLDAHSFSLLASISLTNRSRVKDLWIFTGPGPASFDELSRSDSPVPSILNSSHPDIKRSLQSHEQADHSHRRFPTDPIHASLPQAQFHPRAATDSPRLSATSATLRKGPPRAQLPISVYDGEMVDTSADDMAKIASPYATPDVFYSTAPLGAVRSRSPERQTVFDSRDFSPPPPLSDSTNETPAYTPSPSAENTVETRIVALHTPGASSTSDHGQKQSSQELLGPTAFRDSAFSSNTDMTMEIPIKWTGTRPESRPSMQPQESLAPMLPGAWQPTPIEEKPENIADQPMDIRLAQDKVPENRIQQVGDRVDSPELSAGDGSVRKSEAGLIGMISEVSEGGVGKQDDLSGSSSGKGWVLVNVEGKPAPLITSPMKLSEDQPNGTPALTHSPDAMSPVASSPGPGGTPHPSSSMSPAAKAIVIIDAVEAKKGKSSKDETEDTPKKVRRWFSVTRKEVSENASDPDGTGSKRKAKERSGLGLQERFRMMGMPEASRNKNRRSIDG